MRGAARIQARLSARTRIIRALLVCALLLTPLPALAATRVALLIGEGDYYRPPPDVHGWFWPKLANPTHDVDLVAGKLKLLGFDTTVAVNVGRADMLQAIATFAVKAAQADDAVVYYAGHGFEYARHNYLVPIDAPAQADAGQLAQTYVDLDEVAQAASKARHINIFFLDACRTKNSQVQISGLAKPYVDDIEFKPGTPVAVFYSTARGEEAFDHGIAAPPPQDYSPFAWFVAQYMTLPRTSLGDFFIFVNAKVQESTKAWGPQSPYMLSSLTEVYYFRPADALTPRPPPLGQTQSTPTQGRPRPAPGRGLPAPLDLSLAYLARTDEPTIVADVLANHTIDQVVALAEAGDPIAAYLLGYMFEFGRGAQQDLPRAREWLEQAALSGLAPAQLELGYFLELHGTTAEDKANARRLMEGAAAQGFAKAQAHLGYVLMSTRDKADYARGLELYRAAAKQDYPQAVFALAVLDEPGARDRLAALAAGGDLAARQWRCELGAMLGALAPAIGDCIAAAKAGYAIAQARLAIAYHDGEGVAADADEARHWARRALVQPDLRDDLRTRVQAFGF